MARPAVGVTPIPGAETQYHGQPCPKHGTTERFICNKACVACTRARSASQPRYGLEQEQVDLLLAIQGGVCAICGTNDPNHKNGWQVDHDHETGLARGVTCSGCNIGLGHFGDSVERLRRAIEYLTGDIQAARLLFVREAEFALPSGSVKRRARTADVDGTRGPSRTNQRRKSA